MPTPSLTQLSDRQLLAAVVRQFGLKLISLVNCRKAWCCLTSAGYKYLKRFTLSQRELYFIHQVLEYLHQVSFNHAPRYLRNPAGDPFLKFEGQLYVMTDWCYGQELTFKDRVELEAAISLLAYFHRQSSGFAPTFPLPARTAWFSWPDKWLARLVELNDFYVLAEKNQATVEFNRIYLRQFEGYYQEALNSYQQLLASPYAELASAAANQRSFCHHDFSQRNLLRTPTRRLFLVDFDYCLSDLRIHDLVNLILRILKHNHWDHNSCQYILRTYHGYSPLSLAETQVMAIILNWPQDFWQLGHQFYYERLNWPQERYLKKLRHILASRQARSKFLSDFPVKNGLYLL